MAAIRKILLAIFIIGCISAAAAVALVIDFRRYAERPRPVGPNEKTVTIAPGDSFDAVISRLETAGVVAHPARFKLLARLTGSDKLLKAGEYAFSGAISPRQILDHLVSGTVKLYKFTVPEGYNLYQIAELVEAAGFGTSEDFTRLVRDSELALSLDITGETLEGYLFPDTYFFPKGVSPRTVATKMVRRFQDVFVPKWRERAEQMGYSVHEIVTLASIIEKETGAAQERGLIASVFHNRLKKGMRLEADPTVIYGLENFDGNLTRQHLRTPTPYNTYTLRGLPLGPIANPGRAALKAALFPADTDYLFFVAKRDSTHQFSTTLRDHNAAVRKYQLRK